MIDIRSKMEQHGRMRLTGFDVEGYALFRCDQCGREVGLYVGTKEGALPIKFINTGNFFAAHSASLGGEGIEVTAVECAALAEQRGWCDG